MKTLTLQMRNLDSILYWACVAAVLLGIITCKLVPPKMDAVALAGIFFACVVLKPLAATGR